MTAKKSKKVRKVNAALEGAKLEPLVIQGTEYQTLYTTKFLNRKSWEAPNPKKILSYLPGTIMEVYVKEGQNLEEGDPIIILEAMKMRNKVVMAGEGKVKTINVAVGDRIPKGHLLIEME